MSENFKDRVAQRIDALGVNAAEIARKMGKTNSFVYDILSGRKKSVQGANLEALAIALECPSSWLLTGNHPQAEISLSKTDGELGGGGAVWDHDAYLEATQRVNQLKVRLGITHIPTEQYLEALSDFYDQIVAGKRQG